MSTAAVAGSATQSMTNAKEEQSLKDLEKIFNPPRRFKKFSEMAGNTGIDHGVGTNDVKA
jgi:hypothetical protein